MTDNTTPAPATDAPTPAIRVPPPPPSPARLRLSLLMLVVLVCVPPLVVLSQGGMLRSWLITLLALTLFVLVCGWGVTGRWAGALIDERNVMSLSRFQMVLWTVLILSGWLAAALYNVFHGIANPLSIQIQGDLWWLMGISTTSLVGSPLILKTETAATPVPAQENATWENISQARWTDMITGEKTNNEQYLDMARLQMLFFTLMLVLAYGVLLGHLFAGDLSKGILALPTLDSGMLALITISHGGYLVAKARDQSQNKMAA